MKLRKLAIFDIDGTIFRSSLIRELLYALIRKEVFPKSAKKELEEEYVAWANRKGDYESYIWKVVSIYKKNIGGKNEKEVMEVVKKTLDWQKDKLYIFTRDLIKDLKSKNYFLLAISGSPSFIVSEFAKQLKFDYFFGTEYEIKNGKFTGIEYGSGLQDKKILLNEFMKNHNDIDLAESIGVGDTQSDIPVLDFVNNPIAFNPNIELAKHAREKGWRIVVERKNVIYDVLHFKILQ